MDDTPKFKQRAVVLVASFWLGIAAPVAAQMDMSPLASGQVAPPAPLTPPSVTGVGGEDVYKPYAPMVGAACPCGDSDRCGCNPLLFPWIEGPGRCDQWCVGPHWQVEASGLMLIRDDADWARVANAVGGGLSFSQQFEPAAGGRVFVTGYNQRGYGMQVGYEGVYEWQARAEFPGAGTLRTFDYESRLNSVELNFLMDTPMGATWLAGFRYVEVEDALLDFTAVDIAIPPPADPPAAPFATVETGDSYFVENQLFGFQIGALRNNWRPARPLTIASFANAGVYINRFERADVDRTVTTVVSGDDLSTPNVNEFSRTSTEVRTSVERQLTEFAFVGEAGVSAVWRITPCLALRGGYQVMAIDGVGQAIDSFFVSSFVSDTLVYHGAQFGLEYRR